MKFPAVVISVLVLSAALLAQSSPLKIVVLEGEGGVNIIQQKTAVQPLVEVRDRNNLPVPGAAVTFTIGGNNAAFAGGVHALTITTNAAGQAAASGLNAVGSGALQIQVSAAYQGQIATAAISQTNFATAAAAAQAGAGAGAGGGGGGASGASAGAAGGGGGGISGTTIAIVGAAVGGGAIAATQVAGNKDDSSGGQSIFSGSFTGQLVVSTTTSSPNGSNTCVSTRPYSGGTVKIEFPGGQPNGQIEIKATQSESSVTGSPCTPLSGTVQVSHTGALTGGPSDLTFTFSSQSTGPVPAPGIGSVTVTEKVGFKGSTSGNTITGTLTFEDSSQGTNNFNGVPSTISGNGSVSIPVTLQKQ